MTEYDWASLDALMQPRGIAVIGASPDAGKYPGKVIMNLGKSGFPGAVYPINPKYEEIFGYRTYKSVRDLPGPADVALLLVGAKNITGILDDLIAIGTRTAIIYASGMAEAGEAGAELQEQIAAKARAGGIRLLGPNTLGAINRDNGTWLSGAAVLGRETLIEGPLSMVTQSGGIMGSFLDRAMAHGIGFSKAIATGNEAGINVADCVGYFAQDEATKAIAVFAESIRDIPKFTAACQLAADNGKPIVLMKTGRSERGKRVTQGHTAALIGNDEAYEALFAELGAIRVESLDDLFLIPNAIINLPRPKGKRVGVISASGGLAGLSADICDRVGITMATFSDATDTEVKELQAGYGSCFNPLDITGQVVTSETWWQVRHMHELLLKDPEVDIVVSGQAAGQYAEQTGVDLVEMAQRADKPLIPFWTGREVNASGLRRLREASLPVFEQADAAFRAVKASADYAAFLRERATAQSGKPIDASSSKGADPAGALVLPKADAIVSLAEIEIVTLDLTPDDQVGPFLTFTDVDGSRRHGLAPRNSGQADMLADRFVGENDVRRAVILELIGKFAQIALSADPRVKAVLAFGRDGELMKADYAQGSTTGNDG
ncbi:acetate--CoA ligase family protein [Agrobacterium sp. T29]|uniref:acetate--CoA ligase family protein n=1 Tax=Agrobacterium sp. T29 TaxID=2580515 RepID=UPI00115E86C8|nr:CoA-binding protein [Agrobacterium sp. T29]